MDDQEHPRDGTGADGLACAWIENEGLLRDEGVVFGLMRNAAALKEKEAAIRAFHRRRMAEEARRRNAVLAELDALLRADVASAAADGPGADGMRDGPGAAGESASIALAARPPLAPAVVPIPVEADAPGGMIARYGVGLAAAAVACAGTAVFVYEQMRPHFQQPALVTAGVVAAGCFTASLPVSLLFAGDDARRASGVEPWKVRLAELGLPLVAALFVVAWAWDALGAPRAVATAALLFLTFAFVGRQALSTLPRLGSALRALRRARAMDRARAAEQARRAADGSMAALRRQLAVFRSDEEWDAVCETRLAIFRSEYELAAARAGQSAPPRLAPSPLYSANESH